MSDIQRYETCGYCWLEPSDEGSVVMTKDHIKAIEELKAENERLKQGWISVDDHKKPDDGEKVLLCQSFRGGKPYVNESTYSQRHDQWHTAITEGYKVHCWQYMPQPPTSEDL